MHDRERCFEALGDVDFLHGRLIHVGIFLDGFDEIGDAGGAVVEFVGDAIHFEQGGEASELRTRATFAGSWRERLEMGVGEIGFRRERAELPGIL